MKQVNLIVIFLSFLATSCFFQKSYYEKEIEPFLEKIQVNYSPGIYDGQKEPDAFPNVQDDKKTLLGIDQNKDGVRDDIEIYVNRFFKYDYERITYKKFFRSAQNELREFNTSNEKQLLDLENKLRKDLECFRYLYGYMELNKTIPREKFTKYEVAFNSSLRRRVSVKIAQKLAGQATTSGVSNVYEAYLQCDKSIQEKFPFKKQQ